MIVMDSARILIAHESKGLDTIAEALKDFELVCVTDAQGARAQIAQHHFDLILVGMHFDDSRAVELISHLCQTENHKNTPVILVRMLPSKVAAFLRSTAESLIKVSSVRQYLEVEGDSEAASKIKAAVLTEIQATEDWKYSS